MSDEQCGICGYVYPECTNGSHQCEEVLLDSHDLMVDEFQRILALTPRAGMFADEIVGICERSISDVKRRVPVLTEISTLQAEVDNLESQHRANAKLVLDAEIECSDLQAEARRLGEALDMHTDEIVPKLQAKVEELEACKRSNAALLEMTDMDKALNENQQARIDELQAEVKGLKHNAGVIRDSLEIALEFCEASTETPKEDSDVPT